MPNDHVDFGFFFIDDRKTPQILYFVGFQRGRTFLNADQVVIAEVSGVIAQSRKVAYAIDPAQVARNEIGAFERLCRVAVSQFFGKLAIDNFLARVLPLELSNLPWQGAIIPV